MPPNATGAAYGLRAQIFSQKLPLGIPFMYNQYLESHSPEKNTPETPPLISCRGQLFTDTALSSEVHTRIISRANRVPITAWFH